MRSHEQSTFGNGGLNDQLDVDALISEVGLDDAEIAWRKEFVNFDEEDVERLTSYSDQFGAHAEQIADDFYDHLERFDETMAVIDRSEKSVEQLKRTQSAYLVTLAGGEYGSQYFRNRARIGKIHELLEMPMKHYLGQYGVYYELIFPLVGDQLAESIAERLRAVGVGEERIETDLEKVIDAEVEDAIADILSILRLITLDMQVVTDTYLHSYGQKLEGALESHQRLMDEVEADIQTPIQELESSSADVAESTEEISDLARAQAAAVGEATGEVADMSATIEEIASTAEEVAATSERAEKQAADGRDAAEEAIELMELVDDSTADVAADVDSLQERIEEIDAIVEVINSIADQTNLLALNASIEAANAGEAGDGFAVVANEVKSLAEDSQEHASEIESMVEEIKADTAETVASLEAATEQVDAGIEQVTDAMDTLESIAETIQEASRGIQEVSAATDDQAASSEELSAMVDELQTQAERVADEVDTVASTNERQAAQIEEIRKAVDRLDSNT